MGWFRRIFGEEKPAFRLVETQASKQLLIAEACYSGLVESLSSSQERRHEGVALLLGKLAGEAVIALACVQPKATTPAGSFDISAAEMARVIALATDLELELVAQVHTHPREAFHSQGDDEGARVRYDGYLSLVIPDYGAGLPRLDGAALYEFSSRDGWIPLSVENISIVPAEAGL